LEVIFHFFTGGTGAGTAVSVAAGTTTDFSAIFAELAKVSPEILNLPITDAQPKS
jgi:hypothetical protein